MGARAKRLENINLSNIEEENSQINIDNNLFVVIYALDQS